jgi:PKD repeat protein
MSENKFEKKIRGSFKDHELPVSPAVWQGIAEGVATTATTAALTSSKLFKTIGAAVIMVGIGIGSTVLYFNQKNESSSEVESKVEMNNVNSEKPDNSNPTLAENSPRTSTSQEPTIAQENPSIKSNLDVTSPNPPDDKKILNAPLKNDHSSQSDEFKPGGTRTNCVGAEISFNPPSAPEDVSFLWNFGDGSFSNERDPKHRYLKPGTYVVSLSLSGHKSAQINTMNMSETITILTTPDAEFDWKFVNGPNEVPTIQIENLSQRSHQTTWTFDDGLHLEGDSPMKSFSQAGKHAIQITAIHENGCRDTKIKYLDVNSDYNLNAPSSIYVGQEFMPQGLIAMKGNFVLSIYDNGKKIFETKSPKRAWSGIDSKGRNLEINKQYPWIAIVHNEKTGEDKYYSGSILLRP